jgi:hypothetical protein
MQVQDIKRDDWVLGGVALLLAISLLVFPWYSISLGPFGSVDRAAADSPYSIWGVLALITSLLFVADLAVERLAPQTKLPAINDSRTTTRMAIAGVTLGLLVIKFLAHIGDFGWGFFLSVIAVGALVYFAFQARTGEIKFPNVAGHGPSTPPAAPPAG